MQDQQKMCVFHKETNHMANTIQIACMFCYKEVPYVGIYYNYYHITCFNYLNAQVGAEIHIQSLYVTNLCLTPPPSPGYNNHNKFGTVIICTHHLYMTYFSYAALSQWLVYAVNLLYIRLASRDVLLALETCYLLRRRVTCSGDVLLALETC